MTGTTWGPPLQKPDMDGATKFWIVFGVVAGILLLIGQGVILVGLGNSTATGAQVGDCFAITDVRGAPSASSGLSRVQAERADCSRADAIYRVAERLSDVSGACPTDSYTPFVWKGIGQDFKLCLGYNVAAGDCFEESAQLRSKIACSTRPGEGRIQVLKVVTGVADESACDSLERRDVFAGVYPVPDPVTVCFSALGGGVPRGTNL